MALGGLINLDCFSTLIVTSHSEASGLIYASLVSTCLIKWFHLITSYIVHECLTQSRDSPVHMPGASLYQRPGRRSQPFFTGTQPYPSKSLASIRTPETKCWQRATDNWMLKTQEKTSQILQKKCRQEVKGRSSSTRGTLD